MSTLKKFIITCNEGSLSGGSRGRNMEDIEWALDKHEAKKQFETHPVNRMYGRRVIRITEARA